MNIYKNEKGKWCYSFIANRRRVRRVVGLSKQECEAIACEARNKIKREGFGVRVAKNVLFEVAAQEYLDDYSKLNKRSWRSDEYSLKRLTPFFQGRFLSSIMPEDIAQYRTMRRNEVSGPSVNREIACLSKMMRLAQRDGKVERNPVAGVEKYAENAPRSRFLDDAEMVRFVGLTAPNIRMFFKFALITGMRLGEIKKMRWLDVDLKGRMIHIPKEHSKSKKPRSIPMDAALHELLSGSERKAETVFFNQRTLKPIASVQRAFSETCRRGNFNKPGQEKLTFHGLRHSAISAWLRHGVDIVTAAKLAGHSDIRITARYCHASIETERLAVAKVSAILAPEPKQNATKTAISPVEVSVSPSYLSN